MDIGSISSALGGLKTAFDLTKAAVAARDDHKLAEAKQALNERIIDVQNAALQLQEKHAAARDEIESLKADLRDMREMVRTLESARDDRAQYELEEVIAGRFAYRFLGQGAHHLVCQPCFDGPDRRKSVLQRYWGNHWECLVCKSRFGPDDVGL